MTEWESETHATTTVARNENGNIQHIKCRAEYFEVLEREDGHEDEFAEGVNARYKFDVVGGDTAVLNSVKGIADNPDTGYDTSLDFVRTIPIAEDAVANVPGIEHVSDTVDDLLEEVDRGAEARNK